MQTGQTVLHYRIIDRIGKGGMGEVFKAEDQKLGRTVAVKVLPASSTEDPKAKRRFLQEARAASALNHPNIVTIYSIEETEGFDFIVMEYVEGETLKSVIERGALETSRLTDLGVQIAEGLAAAHAAGFIHRDIKPANILVTPRGQAKILDFGLAKLVQVTDENLSAENTLSRLTQAGMLVGTIAYMSPEQTRGEPLDARTDIFSLGCVLYEAATGKVPFTGPSILSVMHEIATVDPPPPSTISSSVPQGLDNIIRRALVKDRNQRYASAAELSAALRGLTFANRYQILREVGRGGMGVVYLARDPILERDIAIKVIPPELLTPEAIVRFKREARVVAKMDHPAIVGIHDIGEHEGSLFLIMPFVKGTNLRAFLREGTLSLGDVIDIGIQVAEALEYSHSQGVVHRDVKPENILVFRSEGEGLRVRVTDFGLAVATTENRLTRTGSFVGTIAYLSPEQLSVKTVDNRSDIYSLGIVLYECLTGQPPFSGEVQSVLYRIAHENPDPLRLRGADVQEELESIILQCLEKDPSRRLQRAKELADALIRYRSKLHDSDRDLKLSMIHKPSVPGQRPSALQFVGREREFGELQRRLSTAALQGECQFAVIGGEAGIGKTRLLEELENIARAKNIRVLHSRFVEQDQAFPYQGFCEVIQEYFHSKVTGVSSGPIDFSDLAPDLVSLFPVLGEMGEITGGQKLAVTEAKKIQDRTYIYDLLARTFVRIGGGKPLAIFMEELHNADISLEALQYVVRRLGPTPIFIAGTYRSGEIDKHHPLTRMLNGFKGDRRFMSILLEPLSEPEHQVLLESLVGSSHLEKKFVDQLYESTEGNPHFAKELVRSLIDSGKIIQTETGSWNLSGDAALSSDALPPTIQETVGKRIERLPQESREILSVASVLGKTFDFRDLETLAEEKGKLEDVVDGLISSGFIEEERGSRGDLLTFSSGVVRDVLYGQVPRRRRRSLHRRYAEELEKRNAGRLEQIYPLLVHHYQEGDVAEKVIEFGMELARRSLDALSPDDTLRAGKTVLDFVQEERGKATLEEGDVRSLLARAHQMRGNIDAALQELELAVSVFERCKDPLRVSDAVVLAAQTAWEGRKVDETRRWVEKGLQLARANEQTESLSKMLSLAATVANMRGEYDKAKQYMEEAERIKPAPKETEAAIPRNGTLVVALPNAVAQAHPVNQAIIEETEIQGNVFETLLSVDEQGHLMPCLCEEWKVTDQGKSFLFTLRPNVRMHDGEALTARYVKLCFEDSIRMGRDQLPVAYATIRGVSKYLDGTADHVEGIHVQSDKQLRIDLEEALPIYPALLTDSHAAIARKTAGSRLVGTGPFQLTAFTPNSVSLQRNEHYWKGPTPLEAVDFRCGISSVDLAAGVRSGELDLASNLAPQDLEQILQDPLFRGGIVEAPKKNIYFALFNRKSPTAQVAEVRQALFGVVRIDDLVRGKLGRFAQPAVGLLPPGILGHDPGKRQRQPLLREQAMERLESSGLSLPIHLKASVHPILQDRYASVTEALFKVWFDLGVQVSIATPTMKSYLEAWKNNEGLDLMIGRYNADYDDPDNFTYFLFHSKAGLFDYHSSPELDRLMEEARVENEPAVREKLYRTIENNMMETASLLPLFHDIDYRIASPKVRGLKLYSSPPFVKYAELGKAEAAAPTIARKGGGGILYVPVVNDISDLDPSLTNTVQQAEVLPTVFETLSRQSEGARVVPWLASEFHAEEGGKRFRFRLRDDVRFHDGRKLTARDVRYSFEHLLGNPKSQSRWLVSSIRGADKVISGERKELDGFRILSASEFVIDLDQPISLFPALLAHPATSVIPEGTAQFGESWRRGCVGTGPFRVQRFEPGRRLELEANPNYWRPEFPRSDGLVFTFGVTPQEILAGFLARRFSLASDLFPADVEALRHESEFAPRYRETPRLSTHYIVFNVHRGPLSDEKVRHQFVQSIDVEALVRRNIGRLAIPAHGLIPPGLLGYEPSRRGMVPAAAGRQSGESLELAGIHHSLYDGPYAPLTRELFKALGERGFRVRVGTTKAEYANYAAEVATSDFALLRWVGDYPDADTFIHGLLHTQKGWHGAFCGTPEIDRLIERGRSETRPELRHDIYQEVEQIITRRALLLPLFHEQTYRFARPEVVDFEVTFSTLQTVPYEKLWLQR
jgi:serine/threonine protein kinase/ABC-type transport system substrate-binding protein